MPENNFSGLLNQKVLLLQQVYELAKGQNGCIKSGEYNKAAELDGQKHPIVRKLGELSAELAKFTPQKQVVDKSAEETIQKLNSLLNDLISIEKENESMISDAEKSISGTYIESYKMMK